MYHLLETEMEVDLDNFKATELTLSLPGSDVPKKPAAPLTAKRSHEECCSSEQSSTVPPAKYVQYMHDLSVAGWLPGFGRRLIRFCVQGTSSGMAAGEILQDKQLLQGKEEHGDHSRAGEE